MYPQALLLKIIGELLVENYIMREKLRELTPPESEESGAEDAVED